MTDQGGEYLEGEGKKENGNRKKGCVHIYCGDGKGKTSAALGLAVRAAGRGQRVLLVRFLKNEDSGEVPVLRRIPGITVTPCDREFGFVFRMSQEQKAEAAKYYQRRFEQACRDMEDGDYQVLILDEILAACNYGMVQEADVVALLEHRTEGAEVILTGRDPSKGLLELADYVSEVQMRKHPFEKGIPAREGIEY